MTDAFGRTIDYLRLSLTDRCNLRCAYCMSPEGSCKREQEENCALDELAELAAACVALGVKKIRLTGGEPLLRAGVLTLVERLNALRAAGLEELCMTTNGTLLPEFAAPLRAAGLDRLNVSLDTLRADRFRSLTGGGDLNRVLDGLAAAEAAGFERLSLNAVLLRGFNDDEIADLARLAQEKPWSVRFIELMPIGPGAAMRGAYLPAERVLELLPELREMQNEESGIRDQGSGIVGGCALDAPPTSEQSSAGASIACPLHTVPSVARLYTAPRWAGTVGLITPMSCDFCAQCRRIRITADGRLKLCLHSSEEIPLRGLHGEVLTRTIRDAVLRKPARHQLADTQSSQSTRPMNEIGG